MTHWSSGCLSSPHDSDLDLGTNISSLQHIHQLISQTSQLAKLASSLCATLPEEADSCSSSQWDICISVLFFITSIYPPQRRGTLMSFKSHYGWGSAPANTDFPWFCISGGKKWERQNPCGAKSKWIWTVMRGSLWNAQHQTSPSIMAVLLVYRWLATPSVTRRWTAYLKSLTQLKTDRRRRPYSPDEQTICTLHLNFKADIIHQTAAAHPWTTRLQPSESGSVKSTVLHEALQTQTHFFLVLVCWC